MSPGRSISRAGVRKDRREGRRSGAGITPRTLQRASKELRVVVRNVSVTPRRTYWRLLVVPSANGAGGATGGGTTGESRTVARNPGGFRPPVEPCSDGGATEAISARDTRTIGADSPTHRGRGSAMTDCECDERALAALAARVASMPGSYPGPARSRPVAWCRTRSDGTAVGSGRDEAVGAVLRPRRGGRSVSVAEISGFEDGSGHRGACDRRLVPRSRQARPPRRPSWRG
jgi:hypothetical protein